MKRSKGMIIASILFFVTGVVCIAVGLTDFVMKKTGASRAVEGRFDVEVLEADRIGDSLEQWKGEERIIYEADDGYRIYEVTFAVTNTGIEEQYSESPSFYYSGKEYGDVSQLWLDSADYEKEPLFYYDSMPFLPAGRTVEVKDYVQLREGVREFEVSYYDGLHEEDEVIEVHVSD